MDDNRIKLKLEPELTPVRLEDRMDLNAAIEVDVDSNLKGLSVAGIVMIFVGIASMVIAIAMLLKGYPHPWYDGTTEAHNLIERTVMFAGSGIIALLLGLTFFFYGRTVIGKGHLDSFSVREEPVEAL